MMTTLQCLWLGLVALLLVASLLWHSSDSALLRLGIITRLEHAAMLVLLALVWLASFGMTALLFGIVPLALVEEWLR